MEKANEEAWIVDREGFRRLKEDGTFGVYMKAGCHHRRTNGLRDPSACGGCYARLSQALAKIEETGDASIAAQVFAAMRAEVE